MILKAVKCIERVNIWNKGFVELWDFSNANSSKEAREEACALICQANYGKKITNSEKHFSKLLTENGGRASEILGFIPYKLDITVDDLLDTKSINNFVRFGYLENGLLLTNLRNVYNLLQDGDCKFQDITYTSDLLKNFIVMKIKIPYMIVDHLRRHQLLNQTFAENWQSNRALHKIEYFENDEITVKFDGDNKNLVHLYGIPGVRKELENKGEFGLRYTTGWLAGWLNDPYAWQNLFNVRLSKGTQKETRELVQIMKQLVNKHY